MMNHPLLPPVYQSLIDHNIKISEAKGFHPPGAIFLNIC